MFNKKFFSEDEERLIVESIKTAETKTSGEIRLHIDSFCFGNAYKKAKKVFLQLNMPINLPTSFMRKAKPK